MALAQATEQRVRILIVDDEESILQLYANILRPENITGDYSWAKHSSATIAGKDGHALDVTLCDSAQKAIEAIKTGTAAPFSMVFLDVHLGKDEDNGVNLAGKIREFDPEIEIVLVTGDLSINLPQISLKIPPKNKLFYLGKPFKPLEIRQFVESLSAKWVSEKQLKEMQVNLEKLVENRTSELSESNRQLLSEIDQRKQAEESLRMSEENFKKMIEQNADSIMIVDKECNVQFVNPAAERIFRVNKNDILFKKFSFPLAVGETSEITIKPEPGQSVICEMRVVDTEWQGEKVYLASLRDITERKRLEEGLWESLEKNQVIMRGTIQVIARFLEMKDPYTAGHQKRVSELAYSIANSIGLDEHDQEGIHMAALIHDIGKISIPSEILSKPGKLSDIEYDLIKTHARTGYDILKEIEFPWPIAQMVLQHHEKLDGSGYPNGIRGDAIILSSRILTVADVMEAIASDRPYRAALGVDSGIAHIQQYAGRYYDPLIVETCIALFQEHHFQFKTKGLQAREYTEPHPSLKVG